MIRLSLHYLTLLIFFIPLGFACDRDSPNHNNADADSSQTAEDTAPADGNTRRDSGGPETSTGDSTDMDGNHVEEAETSSSDHILECAVDIEPEPSSYICPGDERESVTYAAEQQRVPPPDTDFEPGPSTVDDLREDFGGSFPENATSLTLAERHHPDAPLKRGFAEPGEDVVIHLGTIHPRDEYGESSLEITALLNYRPIDGIYELHNHDRSEVLERTEGIGAEFPIDGEAELIDITIPAEAFDGPGRYDIGLGWEGDGPTDFPSTWDGFVIYYGGCEPPSHECLVRGTNNRQNKAETDISDAFFVGGFVYPGGEHEGNGPFEVQLDEGQTVTVNFSLRGYNFSNVHPYAVVPMVREKPLDQRFLVVTPPNDREEGGIGYRGSFEAEIPDEPGRYDVEVGIWDAPFLEPGNYPDMGFGTIRQGSAAKFGTNDVTYIVKE